MTKSFRKISSIVLAALAVGMSASSVAFSIKGQNIVESASAYYTPSSTYTNHDGATYYNSISDSLEGESLLDALRSLNLSKRKKTMGYKTMGTSTNSSPYIYTDYDPKTVKYDSKGQPYGTSVLSFYSGISTTSYNKEHVWPNSRDGNKVEADIHMPRPTIAAENSDRGNSVYYEGKVSTSAGWDPVAAFEKTIGVYESIRGESARIIFYCMTAATGLVLNESTSNQGNNMGMLTHLLKWNLENPVNDREKNRNEGAEYLQGNRNAFIDHPEYACKIWGNTSDATRSICKNSPSGKVTISKTSATIKPGETLNLGATASDGSTNFIWSTSNSSVATVNNGAVYGVGNGVANITVSANINGTTYSATCIVTVNDGSSQTETHTGAYDSPYTVSEALVNMKTGNAAYVTGIASNVKVEGSYVSMTITDGTSTVNVIKINISNKTVGDGYEVILKGVLSGDNIVAPGFVVEAKPHSEPEDPKGGNAGGCGGSIVVSSTLLCASAVAGFTLVLIRRKKED